MSNLQGIRELQSMSSARKSLLQSSHATSSLNTTSRYQQKTSVMQNNQMPGAKEVIENPARNQILMRMIADKSMNPEKKINIERVILENVYSQKRFRVIIPETWWLIVWNIFIVCILIYYQIEAGLLLMFGQLVWQDELNYVLWLNVCFIIALAVDIFMVPLKAYYENGFLVTDRRELLRNYYRVRFWMDSVAWLSVAIPYMTQNLEVNVLKVFSVLYKLYDLGLLDKEFQRLTENRLRMHTTYMLSRLMYLLIIGSHVIGIGFYLIDHYIYTSNYYGPNTPNYCWIYSASAYSEPMVLNLSWKNQYLYMQYFSIGTMTTIAYGDITPLSPLATLYIVLAYIPYTLGFAYIMSQVLRIVLEAQAYQHEYSNNLTLISNLMRNRSIPQQTENKVRTYFEESWLQEKYRNRLVEKAFIDRLPNKVKANLLFNIYKPFFKELGLLREQEVPLFASPQEDYQSQSFLLAFASLIKEERLAEGIALYKQGEPFKHRICNDNEVHSGAQHCMYFFQRKNHWNSIALGVGPMPVIKQYLLDYSAKHIEHIYRNCLKVGYANNIFGEAQFFTGHNRNHWAFANRSCLVYYISRADYLHLREQGSWPSRDRELVRALEEGICTGELLQCYICHQIGHGFDRCPYATFNPTNQELLNGQGIRAIIRANKLLVQEIRKERDMHSQRSLKNNALLKHRSLVMEFSGRLRHSKVKKVQLKSKHYQLRKKPSGISNDLLGFSLQKSQSLNDIISSSSDDDFDESDSEGSSEDLDNYICETQIMVQKLSNNTSLYGNAPKKTDPSQLDSITQDWACFDLDEMDVRKDFEIYKVESNFNNVVANYHEHLWGTARRNAAFSSIAAYVNEKKMKKE